MRNISLQLKALNKKADKFDRQEKKRRESFEKSFNKKIDALTKKASRQKIKK